LDQEPRVLGSRGGVLLEGVEGTFGLWQIVEERARSRGGEGGREAFPVHIGDDRGRLFVLERALASDKSEFGRDGRKRAEAIVLSEIPLILGSHTPVVGGPNTPSDRGGRKAKGRALVREGIEKRVCRSVCALVLVAPDTHDRGEENECFKGTVGEQIVEVARA